MGLYIIDRNDEWSNLLRGQGAQNIDIRFDDVLLTGLCEKHAAFSVEK